MARGVRNYVGTTHEGMECWVQLRTEGSETRVFVATRPHPTASWNQQKEAKLRQDGAV